MSRHLRSLLVVFASVAAETSLGFGAWHFLLAAGEDVAMIARHIRRHGFAVAPMPADARDDAR